MQDEPFPDILKQLVNQKYTVSILLEKANIVKGSTVYRANEIIQEIEAVGTYTPAKEVKMEIEAPSITTVRIYIPDKTKLQTFNFYI